MHTFDRTIAVARVAEGRWLALIGIDLDVVAGEYPVTIAVAYEDGTRTDHVQSLAVEPKDFPTRQLRVAPRFVNPPAEHAAAHRPGAPPAWRPFQGNRARAALDRILSAAD